MLSNTKSPFDPKDFLAKADGGRTIAKYPRNEIIFSQGDPADDKAQRGGPDRSRVSGEEQYEVAYFAEKHGLSNGEARRIIEAAGPSREKADAAAERDKKR